MFAASKTAGAAATSGSAWDVSTATYTGTNNFVYVGAQEATSSGLFIKPDGLVMYTIGSGNDAIYQYNLSTAWDVGTATYSGVSKAVNGQDTTPSGLFFKPDGTKMYMVGSATDSVYEYDLTTAWDISTASFLQSESVAGQDTVPQDLYFRDDGLMMFVLGSTNDAVYQYDLGTAWNITTANFTVSKSVAAQDNTPLGLFFKSDGTEMYIVGSQYDSVYEYALSTPWNVTTAVFQTSEVLVNETTPSGLFFKDDGTKMYVIGNVQDRVYQYSLPNAWNISPANLATVGNYFLYIAAQGVNPQGIYFKPDGSQLYIVDSTTDNVFQYALSTAWNLQTAAYTGNSYPVSSQAASPQGLFFKPDGTKMYIVDLQTDSVYEYSLGTAWDLSTASYGGNFVLISALDTSPQGLFFKPDGTKMYIVGVSSDSVHEFDLPTAWNVSTASYLQSKSVAAQDTNPSDVFFKPDGLSMYVTGGTNDTVFQYTLSTAWSVTTATYASKSYNVFAFGSDLSGLFFKDDGTKMYTVDANVDQVYQFNVG